MLSCRSLITVLDFISIDGDRDECSWKLTFQRFGGNWASRSMYHVRPTRVIVNYGTRSITIIACPHFTNRASLDLF
jgi:hypothetical protein